MKILLVHSDFIEYEAKKKAIDTADEAGDKKRVEDCLVVFTSAEEGDNENVVEKTIAEIKKVAEQVKTKTIVVYPFVHLTSTPSKPAFALEALRKIESSLKHDYEVHRAPFGWYKSFNVKGKGHPLSELSREIRSDGTHQTKQAVVKHVEEKYDHKELLRQISKTTLDRENLKENDHRIIGQQLDLFSFSELAPGMVLWHNNGLILYNELCNFWREEHRKAGYQEISTPQIMDNRLWKISGHWEKYKENIFVSKYEDREFAVKPMNCPGAMLVFRSGQKSYRDLPLRLGELGIVHRQELSGVLSGLFRVIKFTQDDAHLFCTQDQLEDEITGIMNLVFLFFRKFGLEFDHVELSTRPEKRIGDENLWDKAEKILEKVLVENKVKYKINPGDGAFYGPKIDFHLKDSLDRTWQCSTIQLDFAMPERFELEYIGADGEAHRPVMLHNVIYGSLERFIGILLEHTKGNLPLWLSPIQARVVTLTDRNIDMARRIHKSLVDHGIRCDLDTRNSTVEYKVRDAEIQKVNYIIVVGDKEEQANTLAIRKRGDRKPRFGVKPEDFLHELQREIKSKE